MLQTVWDRYGEKSFIFSIIEKCERPELIRREQIALDQYRKLYGDDRILNIMKECVETRIGVSHSDETRKRLSDIQKQKWADPIYRSSIIAAQKAAKMRPEVRVRNSVAQLEAQNRPEVRARKAAIARAQGLDQEIKAKRRATNAKPEVIARRSASIKKAFSAPGVREQLCAIQKVVQNNPKVKAKIAVTNALPETKARRSAASLKAQSTAEARQKQRDIQLIVQNRPEVKARKGAAVKAALSTPESIAGRRLTNSLPEVKLRRSIAAKAWRSERMISRQEEMGV
jgi:hypothetical protein